MKTDKKDQFLKHFSESLGIISTACKKTKITRQTFYNWCNSDGNFKQEVEQIQQEQGDFVESKLIENIKNNDTTAIIFYLKTKLKDRGYSNNVDITSNGKDLQTNFVIEVIDKTQDVRN